MLASATIDDSHRSIFGCGGQRARTLVLDPFCGPTKGIGTLHKGAETGVATALAGGLAAQKAADLTSCVVVINVESERVSGLVATDPALTSLEFVQSQVAVEVDAIGDNEVTTADIVLVAEVPGLDDPAAVWQSASVLAGAWLHSSVIVDGPVVPSAVIVTLAESAGVMKSGAIRDRAASIIRRKCPLASLAKSRMIVQCSAANGALVARATESSSMIRLLGVANGADNEWSHTKVYHTRRRFQRLCNSFCSARTAGVRAGQVFHGGDQTPCR